MLNLKKISSDNKDFTKILENHISNRRSDTSDVKDTVKNIIADVREYGDDALVKFSKKFDGFQVDDPKDFEVQREKISESIKNISKKEIDALTFAKNRIEEFSIRQKSESWTYTSDGIQLGEKITAIEKVGIYVPGGLAVYPSSVLMNSTPAKVP